MAKIEIAQVNIKYTDLISAESSIAYSAFIMQPNVYPVHFLARVKTAFAGATKPTVKLGLSGHTAIYISQQKIDLAGELIPGAGAKISQYALDGFCTKLNHPRSEGSLTNVLATFDVPTGDFSALTAGELVLIMIYIKED